MVILHCTDFHFNEKWYQWLIDESRKYDLVCLTGDMLDLNPYRSIASQHDVVVSMLKRIDIPLAICSGNHDSVDGAGTRYERARWLQELRREKVWIDGDSFEFGGFKFTCVPWHGQAMKAAPDDLWLIHSPPDRAKTGIVCGGVNFGDATFGEQCRAGDGPWLALSGHVHEPQSWCAKVGHTWSLNPGCAEKADQPNHIVIDLDKREAAFHRTPGDVDTVQIGMVGS